MKLLDRYKTTIQFKVDKSQEVISNGIAKATKNCRVSGSNIEIVIKPSFFDPFAGRGLINLQLTPTDNDNKTNVNCEIIPTSITRDRIYALIFILSLWTIIGLVISQTLGSYLTILVGWIIMITVLHITQLLNKGKLEDYINLIFSNIQKAKPTSAA